jgi:hypothetical protein
VNATVDLVARGRPRPAVPVPLPLEREHFELVAGGGFGDGRNAYAHSAVWFDGRLYVGTTRDNLCLVAARNPLAMRCWPVQCPDPPDPEGLRAHIWCHDPARRTWERVHVSPMIARDGREVMRDIGYRGMAVFKGASDREPALYCGTWSATGARVMRSTDGRTFEDVSPPGLVDPSIVCLRTLIAFKGRLFTSPIGRAGRGPNEAAFPVVLESADPGAGQWRVVSQPGFGEPDNVGIFEMQPFGDSLYAGTINYTSGFQLWKTDAEGAPPYRWTRVLTAGAYRGLDNESVASLAVFGGALYIGTGVSGGGYNRFHRIGPAAAELIRVHPDDTWDLVVGMPRATPDGLKVPLSGIGPGFDNFFNGYTWRMGVHDGWLYVGTYNWAVFLPYLTMANFPDALVRYVEDRGAEALAAEFGGAELWRTRDGLRWSPVTRDGFGTPYNFGIRTLVSTPRGLFVGTANPFGPVVAERTGTGWAYRPNPRGGCEIWRGRRPDVPAPAPVVRPIVVRGPRPALRGLYRRCAREAYARLAAEFYEHSGYDQMGYWADGATSARAACEALMERLLGPATGEPGPVLDVECGEGGSTRFLLRRFPAEQVAAIGHRQRAWHELVLAHKGLTLQHMEPGELEFGDATFRLVVSV